MYLCRGSWLYDGKNQLRMRKRSLVGRCRYDRLRFRGLADATLSPLSSSRLFLSPPEFVLQTTMLTRKHRVIATFPSNRFYVADSFVFSQKSQWNMLFESVIRRLTSKTSSLVEAAGSSSASRCLPHFFRGKVVRGYGRGGHKLGCPTGKCRTKSLSSK